MNEYIFLKMRIMKIKGNSIINFEDTYKYITYYCCLFLIEALFFNPQCYINMMMKKA